MAHMVDDDDDRPAGKGVAPRRDLKAGRLMPRPGSKAARERAAVVLSEAARLRRVGNEVADRDLAVVYWQKAARIEKGQELPGVLRPPLSASVVARVAELRKLAAAVDPVLARVYDAQADELERGGS